MDNHGLVTSDDHIICKIEKVTTSLFSVIKDLRFLPKQTRGGGTPSH